MPAIDDYVIVLGIAGAAFDRMGKVVAHGDAGGRGVRYFDLDVTAQDHVAPLDSVRTRIALFKKSDYQQALLDRWTLVSDQYRIHRCHPNPPVQGQGCYAKGQRCKSNAPWIECTAGERALFANEGRVAELRGNLREVSEQELADIPSTVPFAQWVDIRKSDLSTITPGCVMAIDDGTVVRVDIEAGAHTARAIASLWTTIALATPDPAPHGVDQVWAELRSYAHMARIHLRYIDIFKMPHVVADDSGVAQDDQAGYDGRYAYVLRHDDTFYPLILVPELESTTMRSSVVRPSTTKARGRIRTLLIQATRAYLTYHVDLALRAGGIDHALAALPNDLGVIRHYLFYSGDEHAVQVAEVPSALEACNQCVKMLVGSGMSDILSYYMTEYMTKQGFTETKTSELYQAALQRLAMRVEPGDITKEQYARRQAIACALAQTRDFSMSAPYAALLLEGNDPHLSSHVCVFLPLYAFIGSGRPDQFITEDAPIEDPLSTGDVSLVDVEATVHTAEFNGEAGPTETTAVPGIVAVAGAVPEDTTDATPWNNPDSGGTAGPGSVHAAGPGRGPNDDEERDPGGTIMKCNDAYVCVNKKDEYASRGTRLERLCPTRFFERYVRAARPTTHTTVDPDREHARDVQAGVAASRSDASVTSGEDSDDESTIIDDAEDVADAPTPGPASTPASRRQATFHERAAQWISGNHEIDCMLEKLYEWKLPNIGNTYALPRGRVTHAEERKLPPGFRGCLRLAEFYGDLRIDDFVSWVEALGFSVRYDTERHGQLYNECGFIASAVLEELIANSGESDFMHVDVASYARSEERIREGNNIHVASHLRTESFVNSTEIGPDLTGTQVFAIATSKLAD